MKQLINIGLVGFKVISKLAKFLKVISAVAFIATYSFLFTWQFALLLFIALLVHEYGHIRAMQSVGIQTKGIYFIPFMGGLAVANSGYKTRSQQFHIAIMGPIYGSFLSLSALALYFYTGNIYFGAASSFIALMNLINLLPISPLDGGHILKSIAFSFHGQTRLAKGIVIGIAVIILSILIYAQIWLFVFFAAIGLIEVVMAKKNDIISVSPMTASQRWSSILKFVILTVSLIACIYYGDTSHQLMEILQ